MTRLNRAGKVIPAAAGAVFSSLCDNITRGRGEWGRRSTPEAAVWPDLPEHGEPDKTGKIMEEMPSFDPELGVS